MTKTTIEAAIKRASACSPSSARDAVLANLDAHLRHLRVFAKEKLADGEDKRPAFATYTREQDIETDLRDIETRDAFNKA